MVEFKKGQIILTSLVFTLVFVLVYSPHINYDFPLHVDEWHHIQEAAEIKSGDYSLDSASFRIGFQLILLVLSSFIDLVLAYKLFPALWAVVSAIILYIVVYKKTENIWTSILSVVFFASIKSNVNLMGLWFFTPLTFAIPFIFAFFYFYSEGLEKKNKKHILISLIFMISLIPFHIISFSFAIPILLIYSIFHRKYILKEWKFFSWFLLIPLISILFYSLVMNVSFSNLFSEVISALSFEHGWGVYERTNSFLEIYSLVGYFFAIVGFLTLAFSKKRNHLLYLIWPVVLLISIFFFRLFEVSYFSPYQRNMYYFAISLPFLSAIGAKWFFKTIKEVFSEFHIKLLWDTLFYFLILISLLSIFIGYFDISPGINIYQPITEDQYSAFKFMENQEKGVILTQAMEGIAVYPISGLQPHTSLFFYGRERKEEVREFYNANCSEKEDYLSNQDVDYVFHDFDLNCEWEVIYNETAWIYDVKEFKKS